MITDIPEWALQLVYALDRAEQSHSPYYNLEVVDSKPTYVAVRCPTQPLINLVPGEIIDAVRLAAQWTPEKVEAE